jgi:hypothetical protein
MRVFVIGAGLAGMKVRLMRGALSNAFAYIAGNDKPSSPGSQYLEAIVTAATRHGFPDPYIRQLRTGLAAEQSEG